MADKSAAKKAEWMDVRTAERTAVSMVAPWDVQKAVRSASDSAVCLAAKKADWTVEWWAAWMAE